MMGDKMDSDPVGVKRRISWESIPLFIGGELKLTPDEEREKQEKELL